MKNNVHSTFSIEYTNYIKGIAIILLLVHHFIYVDFHIPFKSGNIHELIVLLCKVCVPIFCVLSGFGITKSYKKRYDGSFAMGVKFTYEHIKKLVFNYWCVYIPVLLASLAFGFLGYPTEVYGTGIKGVINFFLDFLGMRAMFYTPTYNNTWWFIEATLVYYLLFPLIFKAYKRVPFITMFFLIIPLLYVQFFSVPKFLQCTTNREIFYLFSFTVGMVLADRDILDKVVKQCDERKQIYFIISVASLLIGVISAMFIKLIGMLIFALSIIAFAIFLKSIKLSFSKTFEFFGRYSMNVFLIHSLYMPYVINYLVFKRLGIINYAIQFVVVLISNFLIAVILERIKKFVRIYLLSKNKNVYVSK